MNRYKIILEFWSPEEALVYCQANNAEEAQRNVIEFFSNLAKDQARDIRVRECEDLGPSEEDPQLEETPTEIEPKRTIN